MAPIDPTSTKRIRVHYNGPFGNHTMLFHSELAVTLADFRGDVEDVVTDMANCQYNGTIWDTAESAAAGSDLFFPISDWTPIESGSAFEPIGGSSPSAFVQFGGRSTTTGVRVKLYLFETYLLPTQNMKYTPGENAAVDTVITELQSVDCNIGCIDGSSPSWYSYANSGQNDYLTHRARR